MIVSRSGICHVFFFRILWSPLIGAFRSAKLVIVYLSVLYKLVQFLLPASAKWLDWNDGAFSRRKMILEATLQFGAASTRDIYSIVLAT